FILSLSVRPPCSPLFPYTTLFRSVPGRFAVAIENPRRYRSIAAAGLALFGLTSVVALTAWEALLVRAGSSDALIHTNRLAVYWRSEEHTSELQSLRHLVCRLLLEK